MIFEQSQPAARPSYSTLTNLMMTIAVMRMIVTGEGEKRETRDKDAYDNINRIKLVIDMELMMRVYQK